MGGFKVKKVVVTGARGLLGWHASAILHAENCKAAFRRAALPFDLVRLDRAAFNDPDRLASALNDADVVLHFAGVNRGEPEEVEAANPRIAQTLAAGIERSETRPHVVYANSTHARTDTSYGGSKRRAAEILAGVGGGFTNLILPHIFGEAARPDYNNVTATLIDRVVKGETPTINPDGVVQLLHAGQAARLAVDEGVSGSGSEVAPDGRATRVQDLYDMVQGFHRAYSANVFPDLGDPFALSLFNSYRAALYPAAFPRALKLNTDPRGVLFEAVVGGGGGQSFASWTEPGVTRGNHFHLRKVERFLVLQGEAIIRIRRVLGNEMWEYRVSGTEPAVVDMPTLHTHSIENVGDTPLLTLFWTNEIFDPSAPDTYADPVLGDQT
jgi:UDP-2-acetamido-2,6-beta-L-arabino-hexul-4-ose reductase